MRIGDAAARLGTEPHVLRHWEDEGVLVPRRLASGHRDYDEDSLGRARMIRVAQGAGMSLAEIRELATASRDQRRTAIAGHQDRLRQQMTLLQAMDGFLAHVGDCVHPVLSDCPDCSAFVTYCESAPSRRYGTQIAPLYTAALSNGIWQPPRRPADQAARLGRALVPKPLASLPGRRQDRTVKTSEDAETVTLWRPTGPEEIALVEASGWREWPPRLPEQPIFYPVLNEEYATKIARDWNVKASGSGYVTRFEVRRGFLDRYEVRQAGGRTILEYWIPAGDLSEFNANIVGLIEVTAEYHRDPASGDR